jgi:hypothetical protein
LSPSGIAEITILRVPGKRKASTPRQYRDAFIARTKSARLMSGKDRGQVIAELGERAGVKITLDTYKKWETRTLLPHHLIIPFCQVTELDPYLLLTGSPFRLGRHPPPQSTRESKTAA